MSIASDEYQTPKKYIRAAIEVMGSIDLDPACSHANYKRLSKYIKNYYAEDGLEKSWYGNIWLNEPYSKPNLTLWTNELIMWFCNTVMINQAINLVPSYTGEGWYQALLTSCNAIYLPNHRIHFLLDGKFQSSPRFSSTFFYFGQSADLFIEIYSQFGGKCFKN